MSESTADARLEASVSEILIERSSLEARIRELGEDLGGFLCLAARRVGDERAGARPVGEGERRGGRSEVEERMTAVGHLLGLSLSGASRGEGIDWLLKTGDRTSVQPEGP